MNPELISSFKIFLQKNNLPLILLTGGTGTVGKKLLERLKGRYKVLILTRNPSEFFQKIPECSDFFPVSLDWMEEEEKIRSILFSLKNLDAKFHAILHLAGQVSSEGGSSLEYQKVNSESTRLLVEVFKEQSVPFLLASSISVYGKSAESEDDPLQGTSEYALSKIQAERFLCNSSYPGIRTIFRISSLYGKGTKSFLSKLASIAKRRMVLLFPKQIGKSFLHIEDLVDTLCQWMERPQSGIFHLSEGTKTDFRSLSLQLGNLYSGKRGITYALTPISLLLRGWIPIPFWVWSLPLRILHKLVLLVSKREFFPLEGLLKEQYVSPAKANRELGFLPKHSIQALELSDIE